MANFSKKSSNSIIKQLRLTARNLRVVDLETYLVELNIHEDIFGNAVHGTLTLNDNRDLQREMSFEGEEFLYIHIGTAGHTEDEELEIKKEFRVYSVTDRSINKNLSNKVFRLHFCSKEMFRDTQLPIFAPFDGDIGEVVEEIFTEYIQIPRYPDGPDNELEILDEPANPVKFISPGWTPFKCMNWLSSKSISSEGRACTYLFWETTKRFYFGSVEKVFADLAEAGEEGAIGFYKYQERDFDSRNYEGIDAQREFFSVNAIELMNTTDTLKLASEGEIASVALCIDINKKEFTNTVYEHPEEWEKYTHLMPSEESQALWSVDFNANPNKAIYFTPKNTHLYDEFDNNVNEVFKDIFGKRIANLRDIANFKIHIEIQGRTDIQAGSVIHLEWPDTLLKTEEGWSDPGIDRRYTGYYLVTAVRHKVSGFNYVCLLEVVKDAFDVVLSDDSLADYVVGEAGAADAAVQEQIAQAGVA